MTASDRGRAARRRAFALALAGALVAFGTSACGPPPKPSKTANVTAGAMPSGASWDGVYFSPLFGYLHLKQDGALVVGRWERPRKDRWGELKGNADGNLLRFDLHLLSMI